MPEATSHNGRLPCVECCPETSIDGHKVYVCQGNVVIGGKTGAFSLPINAALTVLHSAEEPILKIAYKAAERYGWYGDTSKPEWLQATPVVATPVVATPVVATPVVATPVVKIPEIAQIMTIKKEPVAATQVPAPPEVGQAKILVRVKKRPREIEIWGRGVSIALSSWEKNGTLKQDTIMGSEELLKLALARFQELDEKEFDFFVPENML